MSKRNSQEAKRVARERLRVEREKQAKRDRVRRQLFVGGAIVAVLAIAGGIGVAVTNLNDDDSGGSASSKNWKSYEKKKLVKPDNTSGKNGTTVVVAGADAKKTLDVYEDLRCPACASFEQTAGAPVTKAAEDGKFKLQVHLGAIIDGNMGGNGSKNAINALGAALNVSPAAFNDYKELLYSKEHHPEESEDKFADDAYLLKVAGNVKELKGNAAFEKAVKKGTYGRWSVEMIESFNAAGVKSTPTLRADGKDIPNEQIAQELVKLGVKLS
jgi:protein-disulfide isomerase